jgi:glycosyltransferase involved in cell wall biosynthesis
MNQCKIVVNRAPLQFYPSGISYYVSSLLKTLAQSELKDHLVYHDLGVANKTMAQSGKDFLSKLLSDKWYLKLKSLLYKRQLDKTLARLSSGKAVYHETNNVPLADLHLPYVTTVQDMTVFRFPNHHPSYRVKLFTANFHRTLNSNLIVVPSQATKQDLTRGGAIPAEKVRVVAHGKNDFYRRIDLYQARAIARKYVDKPFILFSGIIEPRKNLSHLLLAFAQIRKKKNMALVLAGGWGWQAQTLVALLHSLDLPDVHFTGYISEEDLRGLYNSAELFVYPSLYEGFGFPPLEAMACGLPTVLSHTSSLPEIGGEAAVYIDPNSVASIVAGILRVLEDKQLQQLMSQRGFARSTEYSWNKTARQMIEIYKELMQ